MGIRSAYSYHYEMHGLGRFTLWAAERSSSKLSVYSAKPMRYFGNLRLLFPRGSRSI